MCQYKKQWRRQTKSQKKYILTLAEYIKVFYTINRPSKQVVTRCLRWQTAYNRKPVQAIQTIINYFSEQLVVVYACRFLTSIMFHIWQTAYNQKPGTHNTKNQSEVRTIGRKISRGCTLNRDYDSERDQEPGCYEPLPFLVVALPVIYNGMFYKFHHTTIIKCCQLNLLGK